MEEVIDPSQFDDFSEMRETLDDTQIMEVFTAGDVPYEIDHEKERIMIDKNGIFRFSDKDELYHRREGILKLAAPMHDLPYMAGKKSVHNTKKGRSKDHMASRGLLALSTPVITYDLIENILDGFIEYDLPDIPDLYAGAALIGLGASFFLEGRSEAKKEQFLEEYFDQMEEEAGEYKLEFY